MKSDKILGTLILLLFLVAATPTVVGDSSTATYEVEDEYEWDSALMGYNCYFIQPNDGEIVSGQYLVKFYGDYNGRTLYRVRIRVYQGRSAVTNYVDMTHVGKNVWEIVWDTETFDDGTGYRLRARAYRTWYRSSSFYANDLTIDNSGGPDTTPPSVTITNPSDGATVSGTIDITATASDNVGVTKVACRIDSGSWMDDTTEPYSWTWDTTQVSDGSHTIACRAYDAAGNYADDSNSVTVDNSAPPPPPSDMPWWNDLIDAEVAHTAGYTGKNTVVVLLDTGLGSNWQTFFPQENILSQYALSYTKSYGKDNIDWNQDTEGHGTSTCATIIGYQLDAATYVTGVAPDAKIVPIRIIYWTGGWPPTTGDEMIQSWIDAINYARSLHSGALSGYHMVISMSLGYSEQYSKTNALQNALAAAVADGIAVSVSAGNDGPNPNTTGYPAKFENEVATIAAAGWFQNSGYGLSGLFLDIPEGDYSQLHLADFSSRGSTVDVTGIGKWLILPSSDGNFYYISGTSFSCPQVSGVICLMFEKYGAQSFNWIENQLETTALDFGPSGWDDGWGYGFVQADAALGL